MNEYDIEIAKTGDISQKSELASKRNISIEFQNILCNDALCFRKKLAANPTICGNTALNLALDSNWEIRALIAEHTSDPGMVFLAEDIDYRVRCALAKNKDIVDEHTIGVLLHHEDSEGGEIQEVLDELLYYNQCTLIEFIKNKTTNINHIKYIHNNRFLHAENKDYISYIKNELCKIQESSKDNIINIIKRFCKDDIDDDHLKCLNKNNLFDVYCSLLHYKPNGIYFGLSINENINYETQKFLLNKKDIQINKNLASNINLHKDLYKELVDWKNVDIMFNLAANKKLPPDVQDIILTYYNENTTFRPHQQPWINVVRELSRNKNLTHKSQHKILSINDKMSLRNLALNKSLYKDVAEKLKLVNDVIIQENLKIRTDGLKRISKRTSIQSDLTETAKRVAVAQSLKLIREPLMNLLSTQIGDNKQTKKFICKFLDSDFGEMFLSLAIGAALEVAPFPGVSCEMKSSIASEFRVKGYTDAGVMLSDLAIDPIINAIKEALTSDHMRVEENVDAEMHRATADIESESISDESISLNAAIV